jgi:hypothetical protein
MSMSLEKDGNSTVKPPLIKLRGENPNALEGIVGVRLALGAAGPCAGHNVLCTQPEVYKASRQEEEGGYPWVCF